MAIPYSSQSIPPLSAGREMDAPILWAPGVFPFFLQENLHACNPPTPYRSLPGPPGPESRKSLKRVSRGLPAPGSKKCPKQSRNSLRSLKTVYFETPETVSRLFRTLCGPWGRKAPKDSFETLSGFRTHRARETPIRGGRGCNSMPIIWARKGIPKNLSSQVFGELRVNFLV